MAIVFRVVWLRPVDKKCWMIIMTKYVKKGGGMNNTIRNVALAMGLVLCPLIGWCTDFCLTFEPMWRPLGTRKAAEADRFGGKWILVGTIVIKKRVKENISLDQLNLKWNGVFIEKLIGSLYRGVPDKTFVPIDDCWLSDGVWNKKHQRLSFHFNGPEFLNSHSVFCLVLTIPDAIESMVRNGYFTVQQGCLPQLMQDAFAQKDLVIRCDGGMAVATKL